VPPNLLYQERPRKASLWLSMQCECISGVVQFFLKLSSILCDVVAGRTESTFGWKFSQVLLEITVRDNQ